MLFGEPPPTQWDLRFSLFGIPVRVHPFFWLLAILLGMNSPGAPELIIWILALFLGVVFHELGHAVTMRLYGFHPWITLYQLGGLASYDPAEGHRSRRSDTLQEVLISAAGPGAGFLLAAAVAAALYVRGPGVSVYFGAPYGLWVVPAGPIGGLRFTYFVGCLLFVTVVYGILNLLPVYPLDGGQIAREVLLRVNPREGIRQTHLVSIVVAIALAVTSLANRDLWITIFFGFMAYSNYAALQAYSGRGGWR